MATVTPPSSTSPMLKLHGVVTNAEGSVSLNEPTPSGVTDIFSPKFKMFAVGTTIEVTLRDMPALRAGSRPQITVLSAIEIDPTSQYQIFVTLVEKNDVMVLARWCATHFLMSEDEFKRRLANLEAQTNGVTMVAFSPELDYKQAVQLGAELDQLLVDAVCSIHRAETTTFAPTGAKVKTTITDRPKLVQAPEIVNGHWLNSDERFVFGAMKRQMDLDGYVNVLLKGESGYGKTSKVQAMAHHLGMPLVIIDCATVLDTESWFGYHEAKDGSTYFKPTELTVAMAKGNVVILLDELNRVEPQVHNSLFALLDHRRATVVHGHEIIVAPKTVFAMTINTGVKFAGTNILDVALVNRIGLNLKVGPMPQKHEVELIRRAHPTISQNEANAIMAAIAQMRSTVLKHKIDVDVSTRTTHKIATCLEMGLSIRAALRFTVLNAIEDERHHKPLLDAINLVADERP